MSGARRRWSRQRQSARLALSWCASTLALACQSGGPREPREVAASKAPAASSTQAQQAAREDVQQAKPLVARESDGLCAQLSAAIASGAPGVRRFAEVAPEQQGAALEWSEVRSRAEADRRSPDGTAWELWSFAERDGWRLAALSAKSPEGEGSSESEHCFRPDGSLALLSETLRLSHPEHGPLSATLRRSYAPDGSVSSSGNDARYVRSGARAEPGTYVRPEPAVVPRVSELPFASLLSLSR